MRTIYVDSQHRCHVVDGGDMTAVETDFFDGMCDAFVEGFCYDDSQGYVQIYAWKPYHELDAAQRQYERQLLATYAEALKTVGVKL